eukprot:7193346-Pyramimonas_sp.AAC.1
MTKRITARLKRKGIDIRAAQEARDLGIDRAAKGARRRATHTDRRVKAYNHMTSLGKKLRRLRREKRMTVLNQGSMPALMYG